jgi:hypothetical protein
LIKHCLSNLPVGADYSLVAGRVKRARLFDTHSGLRTVIRAENE